MVLSQDGVQLRPWGVADAHWYVAARDEEVFRWTTEPRELTVAETEAAIEAVNASEEVFSFAIVEVQSNQILGNIALVKDENHLRVGEVMYWLAASARGRGVATKAVRLVSHWALTELGLKRITLKTEVDNVPSQRVAERTGFRKFRQSEENGDGVGVAWYKLTSR